MRRFPGFNLVLLLALSILAFLVMGYHPGIEDDAVYLSGIKSHLNPALYPQNAQFFRVELEATLFDNFVAGAVRLTHVPLAGTELVIQFGTVVLILFACLRIARKLFDEERAAWAGVAMVGAMLTLPVAGTGLTLADQHLHPRNAATALILLAISKVLDGRRWHVTALLAMAFLLHPIMAALGCSFCLCLAMALFEPVHSWLRSLRGSLASAVPLGWVFEPPSAAWRQAVNTRRFYFLFKWTWYEWLGVIAPLLLFWALWRLALRRREILLARFALAVFAYGVFQQAVALVCASPSLSRLTPLQPMRYLQLVYYFLALMAGCLAGRHLLKTSAWRWAILLLVANCGMFLSQRMLFSGSRHLELPGLSPSNAWLQAFAWVRGNTPVSAYFVLDPRYLAAPGEDYHSFRALAERSQLADAIKDTSVVTQVPELAPAWEQQVAAQNGFSRFGLIDFQRLKSEFGVNWALVALPQPAGLECRWHNDLLAVCQIP